MTQGDDATVFYGDSGRRDIVAVAAALVGAVAVLLLVDVVTMGFQGVFTRDLGSVTWPSYVFDGDLWWVAIVTFVSAWCVTTCAVLLVRVMWRRRSRSPVQRTVVSSLLVGLAVATVLGAVIMCAAAMAATTVAG